MDDHGKLHETINEFMKKQVDYNRSILASIRDLSENQKDLSELIKIQATLKSLRLEGEQQIAKENFIYEGRGNDPESVDPIGEDAGKDILQREK